jgi:hypothetical protein
MRRLRELLRDGVADIQYYLVPHKGGKGGSAPAPAPVVAPTAPVEEASVKLDEDEDLKKKRTGKGSLKIPLSTSKTTGLSNTASDTGLKV